VNLRMTPQDLNSKDFVVSFVIPVRRDPRVSYCLNELRTYAASESLQAEIIICGEFEDEESTKDTRFVKVVPAYKGRCIRQGILASTGDVIVVCDGDFPVVPNDITILCEKLSNADLSIGNRYLAESKFLVRPLYHRRLISTGFRFLVSGFFNIRNFDTQCGIKAFTRSAADALFTNQVVKSLAFDVEILLRARSAQMRIIQVPVHWKSSAVSTINLWRSGPLVLIDLVNLWISYNLRNIRA
jgi:dolichyl-phosphate beta-glucosyltransferase